MNDPSFGLSDSPRINFGGVRQRARRSAHDQMPPQFAVCLGKGKVFSAWNGVVQFKITQPLLICAPAIALSESPFYFRPPLALHPRSGWAEKSQ